MIYNDFYNFSLVRFIAYSKVAYITIERNLARSKRGTLDTRHARLGMSFPPLKIMSKLLAIPLLVSASFKPAIISGRFRRSHPQCEQGVHVFVSGD